MPTKSHSIWLGKLCRHRNLSECRLPENAVCRGKYFIFQHKAVITRISQVCSNGNCPPCSSKYISIEGGTATLHKCVKSNIHRTTNQHRYKTTSSQYLCGAFIAETCQSAESMALETCAVVPSTMTQATSRLLAYECCQEKLESKKSELVCRGDIDDEHKKSIKM